MAHWYSRNYQCFIGSCLQGRNQYRSHVAYPTVHCWFSQTLDSVPIFLSVAVVFCIIWYLFLLQFPSSIRNNERGYSYKVRKFETSNTRQKLYEVGVSTVERGALYCYSCWNNNTWLYVAWRDVAPDNGVPPLHSACTNFKTNLLQIRLPAMSGELWVCDVW